MDNVRERLVKFLEYKGLNYTEFTQSIGASISYVQNIVNSIGPKMRKRIAEVYPDLNMNWLLDGDGDMINAVPVEYISSVIPVIPAELKAIQFHDYITNDTFLENCKKMIVPVDDAKFALIMPDNSMTEIIEEGTYIVCGAAVDIDSVKFGETYAVDTTRGLFVRDVYPSGTPDALHLTTEKDRYPDIDIELADVYNIYKIVMLIKHK